MRAASGFWRMTGLCAALLALCAAHAAAQDGPDYERKGDFLESILAFRRNVAAWAKTVPADKKAQYMKASWSDPVVKIYKSPIETDFPLEANALQDAVGHKRNRELIYDWLWDIDTVKFERNVVTAMADLVAEKLPEGSPLRGVVTGRVASMSAGDGPDATRARMTLFCQLAHCRDLLGQQATADFLGDLHAAMDAELPPADALRGEIARAGIADGLRAMGTAVAAQSASVAAALAGEGAVDFAKTYAIPEAAEALRSSVLRLRIRSLGVDDLVFAVRTEAKGYHWYESFGYWCDKPNNWNIQYRGRLVHMDLRTGELRDILAGDMLSVRDPVVSYDGTRILFSYRPEGERHYHLYEINVDGSGLRQITDGPYDDIEPEYLPTGDIVFCSSRARRWVPCLNAQVANLHRCGPNGENLRPLSANVETENTPRVMPDGRILFMRWEYVERDRGFPHGLWTINPDGTGQMAFWGNMNEGDVFIDARPIPNSHKIVYIAHPHGSGDHVGTVQVLTPNDGPDAHASIQYITPDMNLDRRGYRDPYPLAEDLFIVCSQDTLQVWDDRGRHADLYVEPEAWVHEPVALKPRPRQPIIQDRTDLSKTTGTLILSEAHRGRNMEGVEPGDIKELIVLEVLPKPVHHNGHTETLSWNGSFFVERVVGKVPVEDDGSAHIEVPAMRCLFFAAIDEQGREVKRMQSFVSVMPGETTSCVGCHENRQEVSPRASYLKALTRAPSEIEKIDGIPEIFHYPRDIQPILDKHCVKCHDNDTRKGGVVLNGDLDPFFSQSYVTLKTRRLYEAGFGGVGNRGNLPPRSLGAGASRLWQLIEKKHGHAELSDAEKKMIYYWIESWAQYSGTYASLNNDPNKRIYADRGTLAKRCGECHPDQFARGKHHNPTRADVRETFGLRVNLTHPEMSLLLRAPLAKSAGGLGICRQRGAAAFPGNTEPNWNLGDAPVATVLESTDDPDYQRILKEIRDAAEQLLPGRVELPGFMPNKFYIQEMVRFGVLPEDFDPAGKPLQFYFDTDEAYYRLFWPKGAGK